MKHQYFGDENDFQKYGLLRRLSGFGVLTTGVCWMLTPDDGSGDGKLTAYLDQADRWRHHDSLLYDELRDSRQSERRHVGLAESHEVLPGTRFYGSVLTDDATEREHYFRDLLAMFRGVDIVFCDPDNGFQIKSRSRGSRHSAKYLYWDEARSIYDAGHSVLVYQHFPRVPRATFTSRIVLDLCQHLEADTVHTFATSRVLFVLAIHPRHANVLDPNAVAAAGAWAGRLTHERHQRHQRDRSSDAER